MAAVAPANRQREQELRIKTLERDLKERNEDVRIMNMEKTDLLEKNRALELEVRTLKRKENEKTIMTVSAASELEQLRERAKRMDHEKMEIIKQREKLEKIGELEADNNKLKESIELLKKSQLAEACSHKEAIQALEVKRNKVALVYQEKLDRLQYFLTTEKKKTAELEKRLQKMNETHREITEDDKIVDCKKEFPQMSAGAGNLSKSLSLLHSLMETDDNDENFIPCIEESMISNIVQSDKTFCKVKDESSEDAQQRPTAILTDLKNVNESKNVEPSNGEVVSFNQQLLSAVKPSLPPFPTRIKQPKVIRKKLVPRNASTPARPTPTSRANATFVIEKTQSVIPVEASPAGCSEVVDLDSAERRDRSLSRKTKRVAEKDDIDFDVNDADKDQEGIVKVEESISIADDMPPPVQDDEAKPKPKRRGRKPKKVVEEAEEKIIEKTQSEVPPVVESIEENVPEPATTTKKKAATKRATQAKRKTKASTTAAKAKASRKEEESKKPGEIGAAIKEENISNAGGENAAMDEDVSSYSGSYASSVVSTSTAGGDTIKKTTTSRAKSKKQTAKGTPGRKTGRTKRTYVKTGFFRKAVSKFIRRRKRDSAGRASGELASSHAQSSKKSTRTEEKPKNVEDGKLKVENKRSVNRTAGSASINVTTRRVTRSQRK